MKERDPDLGILEELRSHPGRFVSGQALAGRLGLSRSAVWKRIAALREAGYVLDSEPSKGYRLLSSPDRLSGLEVGSLEESTPLAGPIRHFEEVGSTNAEALALAAGGAPEGTLVIAEAQRAGRGRLGRRWESPAGRNLYLSVILRPPTPPSETPPVTLLASVAVAETLKEDYGLEVRIKWPNDVLAEGRKISGILVEMSAEADRVHHLVLGIGVNLNILSEDLPPELREIAASVRVLAGEKIDHGITRGPLDVLAGDHGDTARKFPYRRRDGRTGDHQFVHLQACRFLDARGRYRRHSGRWQDQAKGQQYSVMTSGHPRTNGPRQQARAGGFWKPGERWAG